MRPGLSLKGLATRDFSWLLYYISMTPATFKGNERKIEQKELPNCSILCLLIAYMRQFEILETAL